MHASSTMKKKAVDSFEILETCHGVKIQKSTIIDDAYLPLACMRDDQYTHLLVYVAINVQINMHVFYVVFESVSQSTVKHC